MAKHLSLKNLMFMDIRDKKNPDDKDKENTGNVEGKMPQQVAESIIKKLFNGIDARTIIKMGPSADFMGMTPIALTSSIGHTKTLISLLHVASEADINRQSPDGNYALIQAVRGGFTQIAELLLRKGAKVSSTNNDGDNAFMIAVETGEATFLNKIWSYKGDLDVNHQNKNGVSALQIATEKKWESCMQFLILNGADVNIRNVKGRTPLFLSVMSGEQKLAQTLISKGTDILIQDVDGYTVIGRSIEAENDEIAVFLWNKLATAQKEMFTRKRLNQLIGFIEDDRYEILSDYTRFIFQMLSILSVGDEFRDVVYNIKAIPSILDLGRDHTDSPEIMGILFILCGMLMTEYSENSASQRENIVLERFATQFMDSKGHELMLQTMRENSEIEKLDKVMDREWELLVGLILPVICLATTVDGREWLESNFDSMELIRYTDYFRSSENAEVFYTEDNILLTFKDLWENYLAIFDSVMIVKRAVCEENLLNDEERSKQKALKRKERKKKRKLKMKSNRDGNANINANDKDDFDDGVSKAVGAEKAKKVEEVTVRYDQQVVMPDWNLCIGEDRDSDENIIRLKRDPMQFRYTYLEPSIAKKSTGYFMPQTVAPLYYNQSKEGEWHKVEHKKNTSTKQTETVDKKQLVQRNSHKQKSSKATAKEKRSGNACWADVAKGPTCPSQHDLAKHQDQDVSPYQPEEPHRQQQKDPNLEDISLYNPYKETFVETKGKKVKNRRKGESSYDVEFPSLGTNAEQPPNCESDVIRTEDLSLHNIMHSFSENEHAQTACSKAALGVASYADSVHISYDQYDYNPSVVDERHQFQIPLSLHNYPQVVDQVQSSVHDWTIKANTQPPGFFQPPDIPMTSLNNSYPLNYPPVTRFTEPQTNVVQGNLQQYMLQQNNNVDSHMLSDPSNFSRHGEHGYSSGHWNVFFEQDVVCQTPSMCSSDQSNVVYTSLSESKSKTDRYSGHDIGIQCQQNYSADTASGEFIYHGSNDFIHEPNHEHKPQCSVDTQTLDRYISGVPLDSLPYPDTLLDSSCEGLLAEQNSLASTQGMVPSIHNMTSSVIGNIILTPFFLECLAKEQVKRHQRTIFGKPTLEGLSCFHDFDYYASLYGVSPEEFDRESSVTSDARQVDSFASSYDTQESSVKRNSEKDMTCGLSSSHWTLTSRRWRDKLAEIIDLPYSHRRQLGKIVIPYDSQNFKINKSDDTIMLGFLTDGSEVAVRVLDATKEVVDKDLTRKLAMSDTNYNFLLRYKALAEHGNTHYLAMELCDYTLEEYITITRLDHTHDPLAANRLAWQLLKGVRHLHDDLGIVHGSLRPDVIYVDSDGRLRVGGYGIKQADKFGQFTRRPSGNSTWQASETFVEDSSVPTIMSDVQVSGMILYYILSGGRHPFGTNSYEIELNLCQNRTELEFISEESSDLVESMLLSVIPERPTIDSCLRHPFFWSEEKKFRMVLIAGSDILKEMKTGVALTGSGSTTMTDFLNVSIYQSISDGWLNVVDERVLKEMRAFRQYKNTLAEMVLFIYNCCLHFDKMSFALREILDDPCRYFLARFPPLFMAVYLTIKRSDRTARTCYQPFF